MTLNHLNRRLHLYLAIALLPWFIAYSVSALAIQHGTLFTLGKGHTYPPWELQWEKPYALNLGDDPDWRQVGKRVLSDVEVEGLFQVFPRLPEKVGVVHYSFWHQTAYDYHPAEQRLSAKRQQHNLLSFLIYLHIRSGFDQESILSDAWAVLVDIVSIGFVLWAASGIYMWWLLPSHRSWGLVALGAGSASFALLLLNL